MLFEKRLEIDTASREYLLEWLQDAHAMEQQADTMLQSQVDRLENYPTLKARLHEHLLETRQQTKLVQTCIESMQGNSSAFKDIAARTVAVGQSLSGLLVTDEVIKGSLASYTFKHMEIASYRILISAAEAVGEHQIAATCREILAQEEAMAAWLEKEMPAIPKVIPRRPAAGGRAVREDLAAAATAIVANTMTVVVVAVVAAVVVVVATTMMTAAVGMGIRRVMPKQPAAVGRCATMTIVVVVVEVADAVLRARAAAAMAAVVKAKAAGSATHVVMLRRPGAVGKTATDMLLNYVLRVPFGIRSNSPTSRIRGL